MAVQWLTFKKWIKLDTERVGDLHFITEKGTVHPQHLRHVVSWFTDGDRKWTVTAWCSVPLIGLLHCFWQLLSDKGIGLLRFFLWFRVCLQCSLIYKLLTIVVYTYIKWDVKTVFRPTHYVCEFLYRISVFLHELMIRMLCKARHCSLPRSFANILSMLMQLLHFEVWLK